MNVADLRQHLADLGKLLASSGAKGVAGDLTAICDGLAPFEWLSLKDFASFLVRADAFSRGEVPIVPPKKGRTAASHAVSVAPDVEAICREVRDLYNRAADPGTTSNTIDAAIGKLDGLKKDALIKIAGAIELKLAKSKKAAEMISAIRARIVARKGATQRAGLLDGPASPNGEIAESIVDDAEPIGRR